MRRDIRLCIPYLGQLKSLAYMSFLPDGGLSVGLADKTVRVGVFHEVDQETNCATTIDFRGQLSEKALTNPHYSIHPALSDAKFHLKSSKGAVLFAGLMWLTPRPGETSSPWVRLRTRPLSALQPFVRAQDGNEVEIMKLSEPAEDRSVEFQFDIVHPGQQSHPTVGVAKFFQWGNVNMRLTALSMPPTASYLGHIFSR